MGDYSAMGDGAFEVWRGLLLSLRCTMYPGGLRGVQIETSVIGRECEIGRGCVVRDSYIGDGVTLHEGAMVVGALLLAGAVIHAGAKLLPGCIVSHKVRWRRRSLRCAGVQVAPVHTPENIRFADCSSLSDAGHMPAHQRWTCQQCQHFRRVMLCGTFPTVCHRQGAHGAGAGAHLAVPAARADRQLFGRRDGDALQHR